MKQPLHISKIKIKNFRLLADVELDLEKETTLIVGRNNSGKTSLSEIIRRFLEEQSPKFQIEDFSTVCYDQFYDALHAKNTDKDEDEIRNLIPTIELRIYLSYDIEQSDLGPLSNFIINLDFDCNEALVIARYELRDGKTEKLFEEISIEELKNGDRSFLFRTLRERIPSLFTTNIWAEDPNDSTNQKQMRYSELRSLFRTEFINAQRGLDDNTSTEKNVLGKILENLFNSAKSQNSNEKNVVQDLQEAVQDIQGKIDREFDTKLTSLISALGTFGYPGLGDPNIAIETILDVEKLLSNHTKIKYASNYGILFPESYNGLGFRNLIFILIQILKSYRQFRAESDVPGVCLIFIEEPEAHLHPQMQEVFIQQLSNIKKLLNTQQNVDDPSWPVQFVVSTHSSHIANATDFEKIRYFLSTKGDSGGVRESIIKDLHKGLESTQKDHRKFLRQYLTLTRCDLFFADKAVLVEGTTERLLLPVIVKKLEEAEPHLPRLTSQYISIIEVGGAYAHIFFPLLDFLELHSLIITDLDSVEKIEGRACPVHEGETTSNYCLKEWFSNELTSLTFLLETSETKRIRGTKRIVFQNPETADSPCGRTFEDAFMLANQTMFDIKGDTVEDKEKDAWEKVKKVKKSEFALKYAINITNWVAPRYILDGLKWLANSDSSIVEIKIEDSEESDSSTKIS